VIWGDYVPFDPGVWGPAHELSPDEARQAFERLMAAKNNRIGILRGLLADNGLTLSCDEAEVQALNDWFAREVEIDANDSTRLRPVWYAVVNDVGLFLGDCMIESNPGLRWSFNASAPDDISFQRHVISGFTRVANRAYYADIDRLVATYGHRVVLHLRVDPHEFVKILQAASDRA
jgi:hypothetical protein